MFCRRQYNTFTTEYMCYGKTIKMCTTSQTHVINKSMKHVLNTNQQKNYTLKTNRKHIIHMLRKSTYCFAKSVKKHT